MTAPAARQIHHVGIRVRDLDATLRFYRDTLGFPVLAQLTTPNGSLLTFLAVGSAGLVELIYPGGQADAVPESARAVAPHLCIAVDDARAWLDHLHARGVATRGHFDGESTSTRLRGFFVDDPNGTSVEFMEETGLRGPAGSGPRVEQLSRLDRGPDVLHRPR